MTRKDPGTDEVKVADDLTPREAEAVARWLDQQKVPTSVDVPCTDEDLLFLQRIKPEQAG